MGSGSKKRDGKELPSQKRIQEAVFAVLNGAASKDDAKVKKLRKQVLLSLQLDADDKHAKKQFKSTMKALEGEGEIVIDEEGNVSMPRQKNKKSKKEKKKRKSSDDDDEKESKKHKTISDDATEEVQEEDTHDVPSRNNPCKGNSSGVTRLFLGNLPFAVDETSLQAFFASCGSITHIKWITDKDTGKFYGSAFVEMDNSETAAQAVAMAGSSLMGRPIKVNFAAARPGDVWPPPNKVSSGGGSSSSSNSNQQSSSAQAGGKGISAMREKPENCCKLFLGNLSYDIDDDGICKFFAAVDAEVKAVRWLFHKDSGDFKGCGFVDFWNTDACEKAAALNGKNLLGRPIRIDWTD